MAYLDANKPGWEFTTDVLDALITLFPDYKGKEGREGFLTSWCGTCHGAIEIVPPKYNREVKPEDIIFFRVICPHCGADTSAYTLRPI